MISRYRSYDMITISTPVHAGLSEIRTERTQAGYLVWYIHHIRYISVMHRMTRNIPSKVPHQVTAEKKTLL